MKNAALTLVYSMQGSSRTYVRKVVTAWWVRRQVKDAWYGKQEKDALKLRTEKEADTLKEVSRDLLADENRDLH